MTFDEHIRISNKYPEARITPDDWSSGSYEMELPDGFEERDGEIRAIEDECEDELEDE